MAFPTVLKIRFPPVRILVECHASQLGQLYPVGKNLVFALAVKRTCVTCHTRSQKEDRIRCSTSGIETQNHEELYVYNGWIVHTFLDVVVFNINLLLGSKTKNEGPSIAIHSYYYYCYYMSVD
jgi:hypothetical protein